MRRKAGSKKSNSFKAGVVGQAVAPSVYGWGGKSEHHRARRLRSTEGPAGYILQERTVSQKTDFLSFQLVGAGRKGEKVV